VKIRGKSILDQAAIAELAHNRTTGVSGVKDYKDANSFNLQSESPSSIN